MQTIQLPAGENPVPAFDADKEYVGIPGRTTFTAKSPVKVMGSNVRVTGCAFVTGGIRRDGPLNNLTIENNTFRMCHVAVENNQGSGLVIRNNLIDHCDMTTWLGDGSDYLVEQNEIVETGYGIKAFGDNPNNKNRIFRRNWIHDCPEDFMALELQGACTNWQVIENLVENIRWGPLKADNDHSLLISAPMAQGKDGIVRGNYVIGQKPRDAGDPGSWINGHPLALEIGGDNTLVELNEFNGAATGSSITDGVGTCDVTFKNNRFVNVYRNVNRSGNQKMTLLGTNDGTTVLPMSLAQLRAVVGIVKPVPPTPPTPPLPPVITESALGTLFVRSDGLYRLQKVA